MKEALLYRKLSNKKVLCQNCAHYCQIENGKRGICEVRENREGKLYSLVYGKACALNIDPIEKKPFFHFLPGTFSLSIATVGCNFACKNCQNWTISQAPKLFNKIEEEEILPEKIVKIALENNLPSISYTYTEPAIFSEYALETMKLAKKKGLKNNWVSNGFWSKELFELVSPYLDAVNVDLKSFEENFYLKNCQGKLQPVLETLKRLKEAKIWLEITTLIIPTLNDKEEIFEKIAKFIKEELGKETPWHITQFCGKISWKLENLPDTPIETLEKAYQIGKKVGLKYVYTGNVPGLKTENTFCPKCETLMIERIGYVIKRYDDNGKCSKCGENLSIINE
jgi:pyruvate formate lyase activating enzyme